MKLLSLFESDEHTRELERTQHQSPQHAIKLAINYLRHNNPKFEDLIEQLRQIKNPEAKNLIKTWANNNGIPTAEELLQQIRKSNNNHQIPQDVLDKTIQNAKFWVEEWDDTGRSGYHYEAIVYESPAGGYFWTIHSSEEDQEDFNYGVINAIDLAEAKSEGIVDYFRDYLS